MAKGVIKKLSLNLMVVLRTISATINGISKSISSTSYRIFIVVKVLSAFSKWKQT